MSRSGIAAILVCTLLQAVQVAAMTEQTQQQSAPQQPTTPTQQPAAPTQKPTATPQQPTTPTIPPQKPTGAPQAGTGTTAPAAKPSVPQTAPLAGNSPDSSAPKPPTGVTAEPDPCLPGQTVTFHLPAGVKRGVVRGGRYTRWHEIKPEDLCVDQPNKTTTYVFDLITAGESAEGGKATPQPAQHQQYRVTVDVLKGAFPHLVTYHNPQRWRIDTVTSWIRNVIPQADPATESLIYFQPEDDSPERVSVAVLPVKDTTCADLMKTVLMDAPTQYDLFEHVQQKETTQCGVPATWATFDGLDRAQPDTPTKSMVLTFVHDGIGYVISGRARASRYDQWEPLLHSLVRSFCVEPKPGTRTAP